MIPVLIVQVLSSASMAGIIWFVQLVHYPLMERVGAAGFPDYERQHSRRTTWVVALPMLAEAATALWLVVRRPVPLPAGAVWCGLGLVVALWASTAFLQVPQHTVLAQGFQARAHRRLVGSNWIRTVLWTARAGLALWMLVRAL